MTIDEMIAVLTAYKEGKTIEVKRKIDGTWIEFPVHLWNFVDNDYRIKPEPHYRPFKNAEEVMDAIKEHGDWVKLGNNAVTKIVFVDNNVIKLGNNNSMLYNDTTKWERLPFVFLDGTPFGKLVEE